MSLENVHGVLLTSRQVADALGIQPHQLNRMRVNGEATPTYQMPQGAYIWERTEVLRILALSDRNRRQFRRRRKNTSYPIDGLKPVLPRPRRRGFPAPP